MQQVIELLVKMDRVNIRGGLTAAVVLMSDSNGSTVPQVAERLGLGNLTVKYHFQQAVSRGWLVKSDLTRGGALVYYPTPKGNNMKGVLC
jgi:predicted ArsR family transcriptional regulator